MEKDERLLATGEEYTLRWYTWPCPSCSWGIFTDPMKLLKDEALLSLPHARRPTGGGLLFHGNDLSFSLFTQKNETFETINDRVLHALLPLCREAALNDEISLSPMPTHFCQAKATTFDLLLGGKKIGGTAQRKSRRGLLHQASLFLYPPDWNTLRSFVRDEKSIEEMQRTILPLCQVVRDPSYLKIPFLIETLSSALFS